MTPTVAIFIPTFNRPVNIKRVVDNIHVNTTGVYRIYFIVEKSDQPTIDAINVTGEKIIFNEGRGTYASCINIAHKQTDEMFFFCGADDLNFHPRWLEEALSRMTQGIEVVGTNDLYNPDVLKGTHATHYLVRRTYIKKYSGVIDEPNTVLYDYDHNYTDTEFIETAKARGCFMSCPASIVEHLHWAWGKAQMDETYQKGNRNAQQDKRVYEERKHLWQES